MTLQRIQFRRGTAAAWTAANPVLATGEPGFETDTGKFKLGDGTTAWVDLDYASAEADLSSLATVATSGAYADLTGKPTIPATAADIGAVPASEAIVLPPGGTPGQFLVLAANGTDLEWADGLSIPGAPTAALTVTPASAETGDTVTADAGASTAGDNAIATYAFAWGDGNTTSAQAGDTATHAYDDAGDYTVTVTVVDTLGLSDTATDGVTVTAPAADVVHDPFDGVTLDAAWKQAKSSPNIITLDGSGRAVNLGETYADIVRPLPGDGELAVTAGGPVGNDADGTATNLNLHLLTNSAGTQVLLWNASGDGKVMLYAGGATEVATRTTTQPVAGDVLRAVWAGSTVQLVHNSDPVGAAIDVSAHSATMSGWVDRGFFLDHNYTVRDMLWTPA